MEKLGNIMLHHGDCMDVLRSLPDKSFDLAIVDPPYYSGPERRGFYGLPQIRKYGYIHVSIACTPDTKCPRMKRYDKLHQNPQTMNPTEKDNTISFDEIKTELLRCAKEAEACTEQYERAYKSETLAELMQVVKDNFNWTCRYKVVTPAIIEKHREEFASNDIYLNVNVKSGFLLCHNATVKACGNATVKAYGNATVKAYDNATVEARNNATVEAYDNATVEARNNATVEAYDNATVEACGNVYCTSYSIIECKLSGNAIYRVRKDNTIYYADDTITLRK